MMSDGDLTDLICNPQPWLKLMSGSGLCCTWVFSKRVRVYGFKLRNVNHHGRLVRLRVGNVDQMTLDGVPTDVFEDGGRIRLALPSQEPGVVLTLEFVGFDGEIRPLFEVAR